LNTDGTGFRSYPTGSIAAGDKNDRGVSEAMTPSKSRSLDIQTAGESGFYILPRAHADASSCHIYLLKSHRRSPPPRGSRHTWFWPLKIFQRPPRIAKSWRRERVTRAPSRKLAERYIEAKQAPESNFLIFSIARMSPRYRFGIVCIALIHRCCLSFEWTPT